MILLDLKITMGGWIRYNFGNLKISCILFFQYQVKMKLNIKFFEIENYTDDNDY